MLRFLLWRILWSKIGVGRGRPSLRNLANFLAVVHASSKSFPSAAPIWAEWKRWESQAFHKDALVSISSRARSGAIANPDDEHRPLAVKADGAARAAPDGSIFEHAPPLKRQRDGTTRGGYKRRWDWPKEEYTGPNAIGSHKAALVVAKPAEGWQGAPLLVLARVCSFLTLREAASFACVCTAFRCAAASVGLQGTLAGAVLGPEVQRLASAQALSHALGEKVREAASAVDLEAVEELERRGLKSADDILNDPNLANEQVGRLMRALKSLSK